MVVSIPVAAFDDFEQKKLPATLACLTIPILPFAIGSHDHALGITRLNVYAGLAGFYFLRDEIDTGLEDNPLGLPAGDYELAYVVQDRMFRDDGELFYPAFPGDPAYEAFIVDE